MHRSLLALYSLLSCAAILSQSAQAASTHGRPDFSNPIEERIQSARNGDWRSLLQNIEQRQGDLQIAKVSWNNGGGHKFKNSRGKGNWKNGGKGKWSNSRPKWGNGSYRGGWGNGGGWRNGNVRFKGNWGNGGGVRINW
jgi:rSAM-associated Gly-rich repeat protein